MQTVHLAPQPRDTGKAATKAVRKAGLVPCVLYGTHTEPVHFAVETLALRPLVFTTETYRVALPFEGEEHEAILKDVDFHPVTDVPLHADFLALTAGESLTMTVPVRLEGTPVGVKAGGVLSQSLTELEVRALPKDIPGHISIDIENLQVGESIHVDDLSIGGSIEVLTDLARTIAVVSAPRALVEETADDAVAAILDADVPVVGEEVEGEDDAAEEA
ncbi:50S ribosomal protein L25 [Rubrivirga sp. S365]|uniref:50S ribosomal protein L25 n=1 Tax=Rubrivirga sp. S365 TaxID=3076080 RepID=UPI0028CA2DAD|nr:50S ribosomal protein L25 [Rubrivirga sp. S365]MDT7855874.1 50S ribosomal protein L25 [Rubrivirga sp. S365]